MHLYLKKMTFKHSSYIAEVTIYSDVMVYVLETQNAGVYM